jgi:hypothetical protein
MEPHGYTFIQKKQLTFHAFDFEIISKHIYKMGHDEILRRCVVDVERPFILAESHEGIVGGHYAGK